MKILIVVPQLRTGGGQKLALEEAIGLASREADVTLLSLYPREDTVFTKLAEESGVSLIFLKKQEKKSLRLFREVKKVIQELSPDIIHTHLLALPYVLPGAFFSRARCYHTVHNVADREATGMMRIFEKIAYRFCKFTPVAISPYCRQTITKVYHIPEEKIPTVVNGIDTERFSVCKPYAERTDLPLKIITTGRMEEQKRQDLMLQAFADFHRSHPSSTLKFLGDGPLRSALEKQVEELGLKEAIEFAGIISNVEWHLNESNLFLLTSDFEGLPLSVLEAMSCGLPVIATRAGGTVDILPPDAGILVDCGDQIGIVQALNQLADHTDLRQSMSEAAIAQAAKYDISACVDGYAKLFGLSNETSV